MAEPVQKRLIELISDGLIVVFVGMIPRFGIDFKPSRTLAKGLGIQTRNSYGPALITTDNHTFQAITYGYISGKGSAKPIAKSGTKVVGISKKLGKGKFYFFTYDIAAAGEPGRLSFIKEMLSQNQITTAISCSEPNIDVMIRTNDNGAALFIINTSSSQLVNHKSKKVVVAVDLAQLGFRQAKVELHDIFDPEVKIKTTSQEIRDGLIFEMGHLDARVYWIPRK
jgi:hypothetical protein